MTSLKKDSHQKRDWWNSPSLESIIERRSKMNNHLYEIHLILTIALAIVNYLISLG